MMGEEGRLGRGSRERGRGKEEEKGGRRGGGREEGGGREREPCLQHKPCDDTMLHKHMPRVGQAVLIYRRPTGAGGGPQARQSATHAAARVSGCGRTS